jgi:hypothetical protein
VRQETYGAIVECDEDVTATEATEADGSALGMRLRFCEKRMSGGSIRPACEVATLPLEHVRADSR